LLIKTDNNKEAVCGGEGEEGKRSRRRNTQLMLALQKLQAKKAEEKPSANEGFASGDIQATKSPRSANSSHRSSIMDNNKPKEFAAIDTANWDSLQTALATPGVRHNHKNSSKFKFNLSSHPLFILQSSSLIVVLSLYFFFMVYDVHTEI
jgi:hypothetical protein